MLRRLAHWLVARSSPNDRARTLLQDVLTNAEFDQLRRLGYIDLESPSIGHRTYRVAAGRTLVDVLEHGHPVMQLCLQSEVPLPPDDVIVLHKLLIQADEALYLARANTFPPMNRAWRA
jgi:hypothetical protein